LFFDNKTSVNKGMELVDYVCVAMLEFVRIYLLDQNELTMC
jgi:hypothetical protein